MKTYFGHIFFFALFSFSNYCFSATITVDNTGDVNDGNLTAGNYTLREAIANAVAGDVINFNLGGAGPYTITLNTPLTIATNSLTINGFSETPASTNTVTLTSGSALNPVYMVVLANSGTVNSAFSISSNYNIIKGFVMQDFGDGTPSTNDIAIDINGSNNQILGCYIGLGTDGATPGTKTFYGIRINGVADNSIGDGTAAGVNLISGMGGGASDGGGIVITGAGATGNTVKGNLIGLQKDGITGIATCTCYAGVYITSSANSNTIGGTAAGEGNVISGNYFPGASGLGVNISSTHVNGNTVIGNYIGPASSGTSVITLAGNGQTSGIYIASGSVNNVIGGSTSSYRNIISGNTAEGISVQGASSSGNVIKGNYIGPTSVGTASLTGGSQDYGISTTAAGVTIGGTAAGEGNLISGNTFAGIFNTGSSNTILGNIIGPQINGSTYINNEQDYGIFSNGSGNNNIIGGSTSNHRNIISGNGVNGIYFLGANTGNVIQGNYIGPQSNGTSAVTSSTQLVGILFSTSADNNTIGGTNSGEGNLISFASAGASSGISLLSTSGTKIYGNIIGPRINGSSWTNSNQTTGIRINDSPNTIIGGSSSVHRNIISANGTHGIYITGASSSGLTIKGNYIGVSSSGSAFLTSSTQDYGIYIFTDAPSNTIGGTNAGDGNVISGNSTGVAAGVSYGIYASSTTGAYSILGNYIGLKAVGTTTLSTINQSYGIGISSSPNNIIGGTSSGARNIISANLVNGVFITGATSTGNGIKGNYIGIAADGTTAITGNLQKYGIALASSADYNTIGGSLAGEGNIISGNRAASNPNGGIELGSSNNIIKGNIIGLSNDAFTTPSVVQYAGIYAFSSTSVGNTIGGSSANERNYISGNSIYGISFSGASITGNYIKGNYVGVGSDGATKPSTQANGIAFSSSAGSNTIGGTISGEGNLISGNGTGITLNTPSNLVIGNIIGPQKDGTTFIAVGQSIGISVNSSSNTIGGSAAAERNIISGNTSYGIYMSSSSASGNSIKGNYIGISSDGNTQVASNVQVFGIYFNGGSTNTVGGTSAGEGNVLSGNNGVLPANPGGGIALRSPCNNNYIYGNILGPQKDGSSNVTGSIQQNGILISGGTYNYIGGSTSAQRNIISSNAESGIVFNNSGSSGNVVKGNYIGVASDGNTYIANSTQRTGVLLQYPAVSNTIGGAVTGEGNVISGNGCSTTAGQGISLDGTFIGAPNNNTIVGNIIGPRKDGATAVTTNYQQHGVYLYNAKTNSIGGSATGERNIISGNTTNGMYISTTSTANTIKGNYIGISSDGSTLISGNAQQYGIQLDGTSASNTIGGTNTGDGNVISGNTTTGVYFNSSTGSNSVLGNVIGPTVGGSTYVTTNAQVNGIYISSSKGNTIGGTATAERNIISGNETYGVYLTGASSSGNTIKGNYIGPQSDGVNVMASATQDYGIYLTTSANSNTIGGSNSGDGNLISGANDGASTGTGVYIATNSNIVLGNKIGMQINGNAYLTGATPGTQTKAIYISDGANNIIGGSTSGARNLIQGNNNASGIGVTITGASSTGNIIKGNYIGLNSSGLQPGNTGGNGITIQTNATNNTIGGTNSGEGNVISYCGGAAPKCGVALFSGSNNVLGNTIGLTATGSLIAAVAQQYGINVASSDNIIGGTGNGKNIISGNNNAGIFFNTAATTGNAIKGNYIGIGTDGNTVVASNSQDYGINATISGVNNTIGGTAAGEGNIISGNAGAVFGAGIYLNSTSTSGFKIKGNIIGPQSDGSTLVASNVQTYGIYVTSSADHAIGGSTSGDRNIISANESAGIYLTGSTSTGNTIKGNYIGTGSSGSTFITSNSQDYGIYTYTNCPSVTIGGIATGEGNVISGNGAATAYGIYFDNGGNYVYQNFIGPKESGTTALDATNNQDYGIYINGKPNNTIGGTSSSYRNTISDNTQYGLYITGASATGTVIKGNYIGIASDGATYISSGSQDYGVYLTETSVSNTVGGTGTQEGNLISGNIAYGVWVGSIVTPSTGSNSILGNIIGPQSDGNTYVTSNPQLFGIGIFNSANNTIGAATGIKQTISANETEGILVSLSGASGNIIKGNYIGLASNGTSAITSSTQDDGIALSDAPNTTIGGTAAGERNIISANSTSGAGITITGAASTGTIIKGNYIGTDAAGTSSIPSGAQKYGIELTGTAPATTIGGIAAGEGNVISSSNYVGIYLNNTAGGNAVYQNYIGIDKNGTATLTTAQVRGVEMISSPNNIIGGSTSAYRNVISANTNQGVWVTGAGSTGNIIKGNYIGLDATGVSSLGTQGYGVRLESSSSKTTVGGTIAGERNIISGNSTAGVYINVVKTNTVIGNYIGPQADGITNVGAQPTGILFFSAANNNVIGGNTSAYRNIISGNATYGIKINAGATGNSIKGNYLGPDKNASNSLTGQDYGVYFLTSGSPSNFIGGYSGAAGTNPDGNVIAYNTADGIFLQDGVSQYNLISRNLIYSNGAANKAINLNGLGNANYASPTINTNYTATSVSGTAAAGDTVEVFKNTSGGGASCQNAVTYLGSALANGSGVWSLSGISISAGETPTATARSNTNNNTSEFSCPTTAVGLPIELISFDATKINETSVKTYWQTATEINNDYFTVERAAPSNSPNGGGLNWEEIGVVDGAGNSSSVLSYQLLDNQPSQYSHLNTLYYRLKQTDFDGSYSYSNIVAVNFDDASASGFNIYPNPTTGDNINISLSGKMNSEVLIIVRDVLGKELYAKGFIMNDETMTIKLSDGFSLAAGVYTITASTNDHLVSKKIVVR